MSNISNNNDPKFLFLLIEKFIVSRQANQVIVEALYKYKKLNDDILAEASNQITTLHSNIGMLENDRQNLNEMQEIMQLENDTNL